MSDYQTEVPDGKIAGTPVTMQAWALGAQLNALAPNSSGPALTQKHMLALAVQVGMNASKREQLFDELRQIPNEVLNRIIELQRKYR